MIVTRSATLAIGSILLSALVCAGQTYDDKIRATYDFPFGPGKISMPGNAATESNGFIPANAFLTADYCGRCHAEAYHQWRQSLHSNSFRTPFYRTSVNILRDTKGIEFTRHCDSCHNPIAVVSGALTKNSQVDRSFDQDGLTCTTCHSIHSVQPTLGNGSYVMAVPAVMVDENGKRIPGEVPDSEIRAHPERHAKAVMQDFYRTSEFCSACHKANLPNPLNGYKWIRAFTAYDEWQNSKFSKRNPLTFYSADIAGLSELPYAPGRSDAAGRRCQERYICLSPLACGQHGRSFLLRFR